MIKLIAAEEFMTMALSLRLLASYTYLISHQVLHSIGCNLIPSIFRLISACSRTPGMAFLQACWRLFMLMKGLILLPLSHFTGRSIL